MKIVYILLFLLFFSIKCLAIESETINGTTPISPYNPNTQNYPTYRPPNASYYLAPAEPTSTLRNPNAIPPHSLPYPSPLDALITNKIQILFLDDSILVGADLRVSTLNGVVSIDGTVVDQDQLNQAIKVAESVDGVKEVVSNTTFVNP